MEHAVCDALHLLGRDVVLVIEANREVIDGHLDEGTVPGSRLHERCGQCRIVGAQVAACGPCDAVGLSAGAARHEIGGERTKALAAGGVRDHE